MKILYFDCFSGISGDMCLSAFLDLGVDFEWFKKELKKLNLEGWDINLEKVVKNGITASFVKVLADENHEHTHDQEHTHTHSHTHHHNRNFFDIKQIINKSSLSQSVKDTAIKIFQKIADAEAKVHNSTPDDVHFHEVGAIDSIIDIVGVAILIDYLKVDKIMSSVINDGYGFTHCQHGTIPIPVPAVCEIFSSNNIKYKQIEIENELVTPTGAGIVAHLCESYGLAPQMEIVKTGYGAGSRNLKIPNVLRVYIGEENDNTDIITVLETNIDDCSPEILGYTMERLLENGAKDVYFTNIQMKKNRPAIKLTVLCSVENKNDMEKIIFEETSTIGIRSSRMERVCLSRETKTIETENGMLDIKVTKFNESIEYESAKKIAKAKNIPLKKVYESRNDK